MLPYTAPFTPSEYYGVEGQLIKRLGAVPPPYPLGWPPNVVFTQPPVEEIMRKGAASRVGVEIALGTELTALEQDATGVRLLEQRGLLPREVVSQGYRRAIELYQSGDLAQVASGAEYLRAIGTNAPRVAAVTAPYPPLVGPDGASNVAVMNLAISRQSALPKEALSFALFLTDGPNQARFANQARVLPSAKAALQVVAADLDLERPADAQGRLVRQARQLSVQTLGQARVLVPPSPGVKRLQTVIYTQLQRAMLGQISSDRALAEAERQWNSYATARWP